MKKIIFLGIFTLIFSNTFAVINVETKAGLSLMDKYDISGGGYNGSISYNFGAEGLYEATDTTEVGLGFGYKYNSPAKGSIYSTNSSDSMHLFNSLHIYGVAKYTFPEIGQYTIYGKYYLGMSYNTIGNYDWALSVKPGIYTGLGLGLEYGNVVGDLSYCIQETQVTFINPDNGNSKETKSVKHSSINITGGYRFELPWFK
jgi:hypothetical protein